MFGLKPITTKAVEYSINETLNDDDDRFYKVTSDDDGRDKVYIYTADGYMDMPARDVPLLIKALQDFIK